MITTLLLILPMIRPIEGILRQHWTLNASADSETGVTVISMLLKPLSQLPIAALRAPYRCMTAATNDDLHLWIKFRRTEFTG